MDTKGMGRNWVIILTHNVFIVRKIKYLLTEGKQLNMGPKKKTVEDGDQRMRSPTDQGSPHILRFNSLMTSHQNGILHDYLELPPHHPAILSYFYSFSSLA